MAGRPLFIAFCLSAIAVGTVAAGVLLEHYFVVFVFGIWVLLEVVWWRVRRSFFWGVRRFSPRSLVERLETGDGRELGALTYWLRRQFREGALSDWERVWLEHFDNVVYFSRFLRGEGLNGWESLVHGFLYVNASHSALASGGRVPKGITYQRISAASEEMAGRLERLRDTASGGFPALTGVARRLMRDLYGEAHWEQAEAVSAEHLAGLRRSGGLVYLVLNLIRRGDVHWARYIYQRSAETAAEQLPEEVHSCLYWIVELAWFDLQRGSLVRDVESVIRHLYPLCFTNPERGGFLEIDSRFFSQFESINEVAREALEYKPILMEQILKLWSDYEGKGRLFNSVFCQVMEWLSVGRGTVSAYDCFEEWRRFWWRDKENQRAHLWVVEGNLSYTRKQFKEARGFYEKALQQRSGLRSAQHNLLLCLAQLGEVEAHDKWVRLLRSQSEGAPSLLSLIGNSYILLGDQRNAEAYYGELRQRDHWQHRADYYLSTFCFEQGLFDLALRAAEQAYALSPDEAMIRYHLSVCYNQVGEKGRALEVVKGMSAQAPEWIRYYQFTLERDVGFHQDAVATLGSLSEAYFSEETGEGEGLETAMNYARSQQNLSLLRKLKKIKN